MLNKRQLTQILGKLSRHKSGTLTDPILMRANRDWLIGLALAFLILSAGAVASGYYYWHNRSFVIPVEEAEATVVYRESMIKEALQRFQKKNEIRASFIPVAPPVIEISESLLATTSTTSVSIATSTVIAE